MKLLIVSDSHGAVSRLKAALERESPDLLLHLGDGWQDVRRLFDGCPCLVPVSGETDPAAPSAGFATANQGEKDNPPPSQKAIGTAALSDDTQCLGTTEREGTHACQRVSPVLFVLFALTCGKQVCVSKTKNPSNIHR